MHFRTAFVTALASSLMMTAQGWAQAPSLQVSSENPHQLVNESGDPFFFNADTAWTAGWKLSSSEVDTYLNTRQQQKYTGVQAIAAPWSHDSTIESGLQPFQKVNGQWDLTQPIVDPNQRDYWDQIGEVIDKADDRGLTVLLLPTWGNYVAGTYNGSDTSEVVLDNQQKAYTYGQFIGDRFSDKKNVIWSMGGDRSAVYSASKDYRPIWDALAEGVADGVNGVDNEDGSADYSTTLMTYHPRKPDGNSYTWFQNSDWLDINANQSQPDKPRSELQTGYNQTPARPDWLSEGRYEGYNDQFNDWTTRVQAYSSVFAGAFGHTYGNERIFGFEPGWQDHLNDPGAQDMTHLFDLMTSVLTQDAYLHRVPDQSLLNGNTGSISTTGRQDSLQLDSNAKTALRGENGEFALVYTANGEDIELDLSELKDGEMDAYWFNPRNGLWHVDGEEFEDLTAFEQVNAGDSAGVNIFAAPGTPAEGNDWVLLLAAPSAIPEPTSLLLLGTAAGGLLLRRRDHHR